jgi:hypothetical protein
MQEVTITYNNPNILTILKELAKYLDFIVSKPKIKSNKPEIQKVNGITLIREDNTPDNTDLSYIFNNMDAKKLRKKAWEEKK